MSNLTDNPNYITRNYLETIIKRADAETKNEKKSAESINEQLKGLNKDCEKLSKILRDFIPQTFVELSNKQERQGLGQRNIENF